MTTLVNTLNPSESLVSSDSIDNSIKDKEFFSDLTENPMTNTTSEFPSDKKSPIFNNCHFNNVTFNF